MLLTLANCIPLLLLASYVVCSEEAEEKFVENFFHKSKDKCKADAKEPWSYRGKNGPAYWGDIYPACNGREQSPIAINSKEAVSRPCLEKLYLQNYDIPVTKATVTNNGHTVEVDPTDDVERSILVKGSIYKLVQFHFHWGNTSDHGADHTIDGKRFALELHLVHKCGDDTAVVAVLFEETNKVENVELHYLVESFCKVTYKDCKSGLNSDLNLNNLLPENPASFYRYDGSSTIPECKEGATWSVLTKTLLVGEEQMCRFRKIYSSTKADATPACKMSNNYRPIQPTNGRPVYISE